MSPTFSCRISEIVLFIIYAIVVWDLGMSRVNVTLRLSTYWGNQAIVYSVNGMTTVYICTTFGKLILLPIIFELKLSLVVNNMHEQS